MSKVLGRKSAAHAMGRFEAGSSRDVRSRDPEGLQAKRIIMRRIPNLMIARTMPSRAHIASRVAASLLGGWAFVWGFATFAIAGQVALGQPFNEARTATMLLAFIVFLVVFCWSFAAASLARVWAVLAGGALLMTAAAWLLQSSLT